MSTKISILKKFTQMSEYLHGFLDFNNPGGATHIMIERYGIIILRKVEFRMIVHSKNDLIGVFIRQDGSNKIKTYDSILVDIVDLWNLSEEELVLIYGKSILDTNIISRLNELGLKIQYSDFNSFLEA